MLKLSRHVHPLASQSVWVSRSFAMTGSVAVASNILQNKPGNVNRSTSSSSTSGSSPLVESFKKTRPKSSGQVSPFSTPASVKEASGSHSKRSQSHSLDKGVGFNGRSQPDQPREGLKRGKGSKTRPTISQKTRAASKPSIVDQNKDVTRKDDSKSPKKKRNRRHKTEQDDASRSMHSEERTDASMTLESLLFDMYKQTKGKAEVDRRRRTKLSESSAPANASRAIPGWPDHHRNEDQNQSNRLSTSSSDDFAPTESNHQTFDRRSVSRKASPKRTQQDPIHHGRSTSQRTSSDSNSLRHQTSARPSLPDQSVIVKQVQSEQEFDPSQNDDFVPTRSPYVKIVCQRNPGHSAIKKQFSLNDILVSAIWTLPPTPPSLSHPEGQQSYHVTVKDPYDLGRALKMKSSSFRIVSAHLEDEI